MDCLKNFIGIEGCGAPVGSSGLLINKDLPIPLEQIDGIANSEQETFLSVWDQVQNRALKKFIPIVKAGYRELFQMCNINDAWFCENKESLALPLLYFFGIEMMFERITSSRINRWTTVDRAKAELLKKEFEKEFQTQLKAALEIIHDNPCDQTGDVFAIVEQLP